MCILLKAYFQIMTRLAGLYFFLKRRNIKEKAIELTFACSTNTKLVFSVKLYLSYSWYTQNTFSGLASLQSCKLTNKKTAHVQNMPNLIVGCHFNK